MNKNTILAGIIVGGAALAGLGALLYNSGYDPLQKYATVVAVNPAFDKARTPRIVCGDEATLAQAQAASAMTAGDVARDFQSTAPSAPASPAGKPATPTEKPAAGKAEGDEAAPRCLTVYDMTSVEAGYDVTYELDGQQKVVRMDRDPGRRIPIEDGKLVVSQS